MRSVQVLWVSPPGPVARLWLSPDKPGHNERENWRAAVSETHFQLTDRILRVKHRAYERLQILRRRYASIESTGTGYQRYRRHALSSLPPRRHLIGYQQ